MAATIIALGVASLVPATVGGSTLVAGAITSSIVLGGMYIDSVMINRISGDKARSDRQQDQRNTTRDEGAPYIRAFGRTVRVPGHMIWEQYPRSPKKNGNTSGKGLGAGASFVTHTYQQDLAIEWLKCYGRSNNRVLKVFANGDAVWAEGGLSVDYSSALISAAPSTSTVVGAPGSGYYFHWATYTATSAGPDLSKLKSGKPVDIDGFTETLYNDTFDVEEARANLDGTTSVKVLVSEGTGATHPIAASEAAGNTITVFQSLPTHSLKNFATVTHYPGTLTQTKDPIIVSHETEPNTPAYRDRCYSVFENWNETNYGNVPPQNMEALMEIDPDETVQNAVDALCDTAGITDRDTSDLADIPLLGLVLNGRTSASEALAHLVLVFDLIMRDEGGTLVFAKRTTLGTTVLDASKLVAHSPEEETAARPVQYNPTSLRKLPRSVVLSYRDPEKDYQQSATTGRTQGANGTVTTDTVDVPVVLTSDDAQEVARRLTWTTRANALRFNGLQLPPSLVGLKAGQLLQFSASGRTWDMLAESVVHGLDDVIEVSGRREEAQTLTHTTSLDDPL